MRAATLALAALFAAPAAAQTVTLDAPLRDADGEARAKLVALANKASS